MMPWDAVRGAVWAAREAAAGRVSDARLLKTLMLLKALSADGYYHNVRLTERYTTYSIGGMRTNRPLNDPDYSAVLWRCITKHIGESLSGRRVVDIGPAEGFFTLAAARAGAQVTAIHPKHSTFTRRLETLADYFRLRPRIELLFGLYPAVGSEAVRQAEIVICLGLLYHLGDLVEGLRPMVESGATLVIEGIFSQRDAAGFDPAAHRPNEPVSASWLAAYLTQAGFQVAWAEEWQGFVERPGNVRHPETRKTLVATPRQPRRAIPAAAGVTAGAVA